MKKILGGFLCVCAFFAVCLFMTDKEVVREEQTEETVKAGSSLTLMKKDLGVEERDGGEDEGIYLLTAFIG